MHGTSFIELYVFVLAGFVGYQIISRVPSLLHTPLMSATSEPTSEMALMAAGSDQNRVATWLGFVAVTAATINAVGGFLITDRMLKMFRHAVKPKGKGGQA